MDHLNIVLSVSIYRARPIPNNDAPHVVAAIPAYIPSGMHSHTEGAVVTLTSFIAICNLSGAFSAAPRVALAARSKKVEMPVFGA